MSRARTYKEADLQRAITVARKNPDYPFRQIVATKQGDIIMVPGKPGEEPIILPTEATADPNNSDVDKWLNKHAHGNKEA